MIEIEIRIRSKVWM